MSESSELVVMIIILCLMMILIMEVIFVSNYVLLVSIQ